MGRDLWPEGERILDALKKKETEGKTEIPSEELASELGYTVAEVFNHMEHLQDGLYVKCEWEAGSKKCWATLTDLGRAAV